MQISIIVPVYNEEESIPELAEWINRIMVENNFSYEILMIDDGSKDKSWSVIRDLSEKLVGVKGLRFNRNHGKSAALQTGFNHAKGDVVITMDADMQDSPDEIPALYKMIIEEGYELVSGWKKKRHDPLSKTIPSKLFNRVTRMVSGLKLHDFNCGLKAYRNTVVKNIHVYGEMHRYIPLIAKWNGFTEIGEKVVEHRARKFGTTKYGWERFVTGFLDLLSVTFVSRFKKSPMHFFGTLGTLSFVIGLFITIWVIGQKIYYVNFLKQANAIRDVVDQPLFFLALVALIVGVQLFLSGFIAEMMTQYRRGGEDYLIIEKVGEAAEEVN